MILTTLSFDQISARLIITFWKLFYFLHYTCEMFQILTDAHSKLKSFHNLYTLYMSLLVEEINSSKAILLFDN